jgi:glycosyltransferase involved in cell wall biosynthesis
MHFRDSLAVILPTYNGATFLKAQIESILDQSYRDFKLYIFDDGSGDRSVDIIKEYIEHDERVQLIQNEKRLGIVENFSSALEFIEADHYALADQDDLWQCEKLKRQMERMEELEAENPGKGILVHSDLSVIDERGEPIRDSYLRMRKYRISEGRSKEVILGQNGVMGNTILMNRPLRDTVLPFPKEVHMHDYWIALVAEFCGIRALIPEPLVAYRLHSNNASNPAEKLRPMGLYRWWARPLPYRGEGRETLLTALGERCALQPEDLRLLEEFGVYLEGKLPLWKAAKILAARDYWRGGPLYRMGLWLKIAAGGLK